MRYIITVSLVILHISLFAQEGFIKAYDFNDTGMTFHNMLLVEDTLVVYGEILNVERTQWGAFFCKMDTLGNMLDYKTHYHHDNSDSYIFEQGYEMIKTTDGGYAIVGQLFFANHPILIKLDVNGDLEFVEEYPDSTVLNMRHWHIVEFERGYISMGVKQQADDYMWDAFIMRTDKNGEKIWEIGYGENNLWDALNGLNKINENEFLLTGVTGITSLDVDDIADMWVQPKAIKIDSLSNIFWEWEDDIHYSEGSAPTFGQLFPTSDGNWVNEGYYTTNLSQELNAFQGEIIKRDSDFNVIWATRFGEPTHRYNNFIDLTSTPDGGWVAAGQYVEFPPIYSGLAATLGGWLAKVNADGDSLWSRTDTVFYHPVEGSINYLSGVVSLPSGSIIACGHLNRYAPEPAKSFGWMIKVDKHGCIEPGCHPTLTGMNLTPLLEAFEVFPNPAADNIRVSGLGNFDVSLYGVHGALLLHQPDNYEFADLDLRDLSTGVYFLQIQKNRQMITKKIIKH